MSGLTCWGVKMSGAGKVSYITIIDTKLNATVQVVSSLF